MELKANFSFKNVNMTKKEFFMHFSMLLNNAIHYAKSRATILYDKYHTLKLDTAPFGVEKEPDEVKKKVEQYEKEMKYYKEQIDELERLHSMAVKATTFNKKLEVMKEFNEWVIMNG